MSSLDLAAILRIPELPQQLARIGQDLKDVTASDNPFLQGPLARLLTVRGKRLRPSLVLASAGQSTEAVFAGCATVELIHLASLVHDDVIDNADSRWGIPTISSQEGVDRAILVGDYLLAKAAQQAAAINAEAAHIAATTIAELSEGQAYELMDTRNLHRSATDLKKSLFGKTAALMSASCRIGGLCAGYTSEQIAALAEYGECFGMAFQLIDDVLDFLSTSELLGKPTGTDVREGVYTMPVILALAGQHHQVVEPLLDDTSPEARVKLIDILTQDNCFTRTIAEARQYNDRAVKALDNVFDDSLAGLRALPTAYITWSLQQYVADEYKDKLVRSGLFGKS
jgi:geranylgeranyl pyrophosphate synthase